MKANTFKTFMLLSLLSVFFVFIGGTLGGRNGATVAFIFAIAMNFFSYWFSSSIVLRLYKAKPIQEADNPELYNMVRRLATAARLPMPQVCIIADGSPNAFATGRNPEHGVVAVTTGIMNILNKEELEGVIAHELSHINHRDILIGSIAATVAGAIMFLANMAKYAAIFGGSRDDEDNGNAIVALLIAIIAPLAAMVIQMAISRTREYEADAGAAKLTKNPMALASALHKISYGVEMKHMDASPATAHMFIMNPLSGRKLANLFSTHPATEDRIAKLKAMR